MLREYSLGVAFNFSKVLVTYGVSKTFCPAAGLKRFSRENLNIMFERILSLLNRTKTSISKHPLHHQILPEDHRSVYAIGDLHGCVSLLRRIETAITKDLAQEEAHVVLLGDIIDRGPDSAEMLDHLLLPPPPGQVRHVLLGNHEVMFTRFFENPARAAEWLYCGGAETLLSYGIDAQSFTTWPPAKQRQSLQAHIPEDHRRFIANLPAILSWGNVIFAHAGIDFTKQLTDQTEDAVLWNKTPISGNNLPENTMLVHGHVPVSAPDIHQNVINMDVGAYMTNKAVIMRIEPSGLKRLIEVL